jgi:Na+/H+ antiporter NhaC
MKTVENIFRYCGYLAISLVLGWISNKGGENDFIEKISSSIIPILLTLTVLHTTLTNLLLNELLKYKSKHTAEIEEVVNALKRSAVIELLLIGITFLVLISNGFISQILPTFDLYREVIANSLIVFDILYFMLVIYDNIDGWYKLIKANN